MPTHSLTETVNTFVDEHPDKVDVPVTEYTVVTLGFRTTELVFLLLLQVYCEAPVTFNVVAFPVHKFLFPVTDRVGNVDTDITCFSVSEKQL
jgi:hypothetical protein